jgi:secretion/DNA translocation related TadE-like protein
VTRPGRRGDRGSATLWVLMIYLVVWGSALAALAVGAALVTRHRAESAADLAALAAARALASGVAEPCRSAARVTEAVHVRLAGCRVEGAASVLVVVEATGPLPRWADLPPARARARAGGSWVVEDGGADGGAATVRPP